MSVADRDRERAMQAVFPGHLADRIELVATALAEEREKARAPFLALADELEQGVRWHLGGLPVSQADSNAFMMARRIRRAAEVTE